MEGVAHDLGLPFIKNWFLAYAFNIALPENLVSFGASGADPPCTR